MKRGLVLGFASILLVASLPAQDYSSDESRIREIIKSFSVMWTDPSGVQLANDNSSGNLMIIIGQKSYNKTQYLELVANMLKNRQIQKHQHEVYRVLIQGNIAFEYGLITMLMKNGSEQKNETMNVFIKEDGTWKILSNMPVDAIKDLF